VGGTGPAAHGDGERPAKGGRDLGGVLDADGPLGSPLERTLNDGGIVDAVERLEGGPDRDAAGDMDQRRARGVRTGDTGQRVGGAGAGRDQHDTGLATEPPVDLGGDGSIVLVLEGHWRDIRGIGEGVEHLDDVRAVEAEYGVDAMRLKAGDNGLARG
jgi:hypothetical protein